MSDVLSLPSAHEILQFMVDSTHRWKTVSGGPGADIPWEWCWRCGMLRMRDGASSTHEYFVAGIEPTRNPISGDAKDLGGGHIGSTPFPCTMGTQKAIEHHVEES